MTRTYIDSGVLIAAVRGGDAVSDAALAVLDDPTREFVSSAFVRLELLPKCTYNKRDAEQAFYEAFFESVVGWADALPAVVETAYTEACRNGLQAVDALHVASAIHLEADELVTTEKNTKPIHRVKSIQVVSVGARQERT